MSIRRILVVAFLLVSLLPVAAVTLLAFISSRNALLDEISHSLGLSAAAVSSDIDKQLFERLLNSTTWNHLEVMEDLRLGDLDKRLTRFLSETRAHHSGIYLDLYATTPAGHIVAASRPEPIGHELSLGEPWLTTSLYGEQVEVFSPRKHADGRTGFLLRSRIFSQITDEPIGFLVLDVDWQQIERVLDESSTKSRQILIIDDAGRVAAASWAMRAKGIDHGAAGEEWLAADDALIASRDHTSAFSGPTIIGYQRSRGASPFPGFGWTFVLLQSRAEAMAPVHQMGWIFAATMGITFAIVLLVSMWIAGVISRPVIALTEFTSRFFQPGPVPQPPPEGPGEVGELMRSFTRMVDNLQQSQRTLTQASKLAAVGEVTALLAHEIRTPLGVLRSSAQLLRSDASIDAENRELLQIILTETERLNRLVGSMLDSTRTRPPERVATDLHGLIAHTNSLLSAQARDRGITISVSPGADDAVVDCDPEQMTQVLLNLMMNALQILPAGGRIAISTTADPQRVVVEIADDGPGIPAELRGQIFDPFVFKREGGLGLGLAVVRTIVRSHGGDISVGSSALGGALFSIALPRRITAGVSP